MNLDLISFTHVVTRAGAAFGFFVMSVTGMLLYFKNGRTLAAVKARSVWMPWAGSAMTMVLASAVTSGLIGHLSAGFTGTGNQAGQQLGHIAIGQDGAGTIPISTGRVLSYSGSWIVLVLVVGLGLFLYYAKSWRERLLALSGAITGATWGIATAVGGWAAMVGVPLVSWLGEVVIG